MRFIIFQIRVVPGNKDVINANVISMALQFVFDFVFFIRIGRKLLIGRLFLLRKHNMKSYFVEGLL